MKNIITLFRCKTLELYHDEFMMIHLPDDETELVLPKINQRSTKEIFIMKLKVIMKKKRQSSILIL